MKTNGLRHKKICIRFLGPKSLFKSNANVRVRVRVRVGVRDRVRFRVRVRF